MRRPPVAEDAKSSDLSSPIVGTFRKFRYITVFASLLIASAPSALAQSTTRVNYSAPLTLPFIADAAETPLADGNEVRIGFFDDGFVPGDHTHDLPALQAAWNEYDDTPIREIETAPGEPGRFGDNPTSIDPAFNGKRIYLWIFKTGDASAPAPDFSNVLEYSLFTNLTNPQWIFPSTAGLPGQTTNNITTADVTEAINGTIATGKLLTNCIPRTYDQWAADDTVFPPATPAADRLPDANPDGDPLTNLEEFFHVRSPVTADSSPLDWIVRVNDNPRTAEVTFPRRKNLNGVQLHIESASNLVDWHPVTGATETILSAPGADPASVRLDFPIPTETECFFRTVISLE